jgi:hypothetical protein
MKIKILSVCCFFLFFPIIILGQCYLLFSFASSPDKLSEDVHKFRTGSFHYLLSNGLGFLSSNQQEEVVVDVYAVGGDSRPLILKKYLEHYNSPMADYADYIFKVSQENGLDYRLLIAIAQQESNLCKKIPENSYNCWGWGIHSQGTLRFDSYEESIKTVAEGLKENYIDQGLREPEEIMKRYTPSSDGSWARGVRQFMDEMEENQW